MKTPSISGIVTASQHTFEEAGEGKLTTEERNLHMQNKQSGRTSAPPHRDTLAYTKRPPANTQGLWDSTTAFVSASRPGRHRL